LGGQYLLLVKHGEVFVLDHEDDGKPIEQAGTCIAAVLEEFLETLEPEPPQ
jgi:hypothetical protein